MFNPGNLIYCGKQQGIDVFFYNGVRIDAALTQGRDGRYLYLGFGREQRFTGDELAGLLQWFGLDRRLGYSRHAFPDHSFWLVQRQAA